ncbi:MAG TPA: hypothetical protein VGQ57_16255 [Polyangiaceae bacterium]|jgi:hypothetical protein|nr:hypothetical protein [Polyangiaceae bacterium]
MQLLLHAKTNLAALWIVSNGEITIGPVRTELLLRGIRHGRVPPDCQVRAADSDEWRPLEALREVAAMYGNAGSVGEFQRAAAEIAEARDEREVFLLLLHGAAAATRATRGLVHRQRPPVRLPVTSYCIGGLEDELGGVVSYQDPAYVHALSGHPILGSPSDGTAERLVAERLGSLELAGVAMIPVTHGTELAAMLELGRDDRCFRQSDADALTRLATLAVARLEEL